MHDDPFDLGDLNGPPSPAAEPPWLVGLNPEQRAAVTTTEGPLLVLSGAGTGKTRVLTARLAHILASHKARPWQVMAVTFTNKAAREMRDRVHSLIGPPAGAMWLGTFHALAARILRRHAEAVNLNDRFSILDSDDQIRVLKAIMEDEGIESPKGVPQAVMGVIQRWKDRGLTPDRLGAERHAGATLANGRVPDLYRLYQDRLLSLNACDFGDLLLHNLTLFRIQPDILTAWQEQFHYLLVDEYQDTNIAQYMWLRLLAGRHKNICVVGDDDQSIYSWRGAEVGNILRFEQDFPGAQLVRLERNYRSTAPILAAASHLIAHNSGRLGKRLYPAAETSDRRVERIRLRGLWSDLAEAEWLAAEVDALHHCGEPLNGMAVLVRTSAQTRILEEKLLTAGLSYRVIGGMRFYERQEIRDMVAYLRLIATPEDGLAFERIINLPRRGLGDAVLSAIRSVSRSRGCSLVEASRLLVSTDEIKPKPRQSLTGFIAHLDEWRILSDTLSPSALAGQVMDDSGYLDMWRRDKSPDAQGRIENLHELLRALDEFESLREFLDHVALVMDNEAQTSADSLTLMTLHAAKGLEFDTVFLPGWEEGLFPHQRALEESDQNGLEEERRLAYVGLTRARRRVFISFAARRRLYNQWQDTFPSRFLKELPQSEMDIDGETGLTLVGQAPSGTGIRAPTSVGWRPPPRPTATPLKLAVGHRVHHTKFGNGTVTACDDDRLDIAFDHAGPKRVLASFVRPLDS